MAHSVYVGLSTSRLFRLVGSRDGAWYFVGGGPEEVRSVVAATARAGSVVT